MLPHRLLRGDHESQTRKSMITRNKTRQVKIGNISIGGNAPIAVQSMCNTDTRNVEASLAQIRALRTAGCDIVRLAVPDLAAADALKEITAGVDMPMVADIHFDYRLALRAIENGIAKLRINPGNIGSRDKVELVARACQDRGIPIRIGVNSGSLEKDLLETYGGPVPEALVASALRHAAILDEVNFHDVIISIKSSNVLRTIEAYRLLAQKTDLPLHIGVTEAGTLWRGTIKSAVGIGTLLAEGIGDTLRVSLTGDPVEEIKVGREILKSLGHLKEGIEFVSCPTCGRTEIDLIGIANEVEKRLEGLDKEIKVAVMGCVVNGPGEARDADIGIAGGKGVGMIFKKGLIVRRVKEEELVEALMAEIENM
ncbi:flavodoxin-dependent (E)-4-hydroxy-3-methylbut-2-enyl-diphosphate synthase [Clostridiaceae bacterium HFYG-1003]|nr:flavodoxin-dependent (E)-4-hydroxy-3-methylbut-2-enyl-diphosphate synthase [Clostridiaceae bacterium HFYG-1003]